MTDAKPVTHWHHGQTLDKETGYVSGFQPCSHFPQSRDSTPDTKEMSVCGEVPEEKDIYPVAMIIPVSACVICAISETQRKVP